MGKSIGRRRAGSKLERCRNPWNGRCRSTDIELYIYFKGKRLAICRSCWGEMASLNIEW